MADVQIERLVKTLEAKLERQRKALADTEAQLAAAKRLSGQVK